MMATLWTMSDKEKVSISGQIIRVNTMVNGREVDAQALELWFGMRMGLRLINLSVLGKMEQSWLVNSHLLTARSIQLTTRFD